MSEDRYQRLAREIAERKAARAAREAERNKPKRRKTQRRAPNEDMTPFGQGDNLGESPDY